MKKCILLISLLMVFLVGCNTADTHSGTAPTTTTYKAGKVTAVVPQGWKAFAHYNTTGDKEVMENMIYLSKGATTEEEKDDHLNMLISVGSTDQDELTIDSFSYSNTSEVTSFTTGEYTWKGFTSSSNLNAYATLWTDVKDKRITVAMTMCNGVESYTFTDDDVQTILAGIQIP